MTPEAPKQLEGVLLCQVAEHWLAVSARSVSRIETWTEADVLAQHARWAYELPSAPGKVLEEGAARVVVDTLEIHSEAVGLYPVPPVLLGAAGGALAGFISAQSRLWPLVELARLSRYLSEHGEVPRI